MQTPLSLENPVFIFGMGRSGTTILRLMMTAHPQFCIPSECLFFINLEPKYGHLSDLSGKIDSFIADLCKVNLFSDWKINLDHLRQNLSQHHPLDYSTAVATVYRTYLQQNDPDASMWGDKNPVHVYHLKRIRRYFPEARFLLIIRDIRGTYGSLKRTEQNFKNWNGSCKANILSVTKQWNHVIRLSEEHQYDPYFHTVLYEKLVDNPEWELRQICAWLGVDFSDSMLKYYEKNAREKLVPTGENGWNAKTFQPVTRGRIDSWKQELNLIELEALESFNQGNLEKLGYQCVTRPVRYRGLLKVLPDYIEHIYRRLRQIVNGMLSKRLPQQRPPAPERG